MRTDAQRSIGAVRVSYEKLTQQLGLCVVAGRAGLPYHIRHTILSETRTAVLAHEEALHDLKALFQIVEPVEPLIEVPDAEEF